MFATNPIRYSSIAMLLHWLMAVLIVANLALGLTMVDLSLSPQKLKYFSWHKWIGVTIFLLVWLRMAWRMAHPVPPLPRHLPRWQLHAAHVSHIVLYVLMFIIPLSGWLYSSAAGKQVVYLGLLPLPDLVSADKGLADSLKLVHEILNYALMTLLSLHVLAALKHHFLDRDDILTRMLPFLSRR